MGVGYWRLHNSSGNFSTSFTGVEINAYMVQHLLKQHLIIPIPDLWMIGIAGFIGKGTQLLLSKHQYKKRGNKSLLIFLIGGTGAYILMSMQLYISASIVLPLFLPSIALWFYILPDLRKTNDT
jgi:CHASE2 domain-containing sensor protein